MISPLIYQSIVLGVIAFISWQVYNVSTTPNEASDVALEPIDTRMFLKEQKNINRNDKWFTVSSKIATGAVNHEKRESWKNREFKDSGIHFSDYKKADIVNNQV